MKINSKQIISIILICLFALLALGGYFLCWPKYQEFQAKKLEIERKDEEIKSKEEYFSNLEAFSEKLLVYSEQFSMVDSAFPVNPSPAVIFNFLQKASSENGLILTEAEMIEAQQSLEGRIQEVSFSISVSGSYSAFKNFLFIIYASSRLIEVKSINFSSEEEEGLFDFALELKAQFYAH